MMSRTRAPAASATIEPNGPHCRRADARAAALTVLALAAAAFGPTPAAAQSVEQLQSRGEVERSQSEIRGREARTGQSVERSLQSMEGRTERSMDRMRTQSTIQSEGLRLRSTRPSNPGRF